jgi:hypothetical protein
VKERVSLLAYVAMSMNEQGFEQFDWKRCIL